jgi:hypothetical protein
MAITALVLSVFAAVAALVKCVVRGQAARDEESLGMREAATDGGQFLEKTGQ